jgi:micrococcal nuclease
MYEYRATLLKIVDGDTVDVDIDLGFGVVLTNQRIRLYGIDTPESRTRDLEEKKCGKLAAKYIEDHIQVSSTFNLRTRLDGKGKYGRILGELICFVPEFDREMSLNDAMIMKKLAVKYFGQSKDDIEEEHLKNREHLYASGLVLRG